MGLLDRSTFHIDYNHENRRMPWVWVSGKISCVNNIKVQTWFAKPLICRVTTFALLFKFPRKKDCDVPLFKVKDTIYNIQFFMIIKVIIIKLKLKNKIINK